MTVINGILLGLVQGVTETIPLSASGHFAVLSSLFGAGSQDGSMAFFETLLMLAVFAAVCIVYWTDIRAMFLDMLSFAGTKGEARKERYFSAKRLTMLLFATLPLFLVLPVRHLVSGLGTRPAFVGAMLVLNGSILYVTDKLPVGGKTERSMSIWDALIVGICQCVAVIPGISHIAAALTAGICVGLKRDFALKFSFLLSLPALFGGAILSLIDAVRAGIVWQSVPAYLLGAAVAMIVGVFAINILKHIVNKGKLNGFAYYCGVIGVLAIILNFIF